LKIKWNVDPEVNHILWERLSLLPRELIGKADPEIVLDLGGGTGDFASPLKGEGVTVITLDADLAALKNRVDGVQAVRGDATRLPFKDSTIDAVTARAILHHFPENLDECLTEVDRVLKSGGLFLAQEPLANNCFANMARRYFSTERHETGERPLDPDFLERHIGGMFDLQWKEHHFLLSYLYPHIVFRLPEALKGLGRLEGRILHDLDEKALRTMPKLRKYAAYMSILGSKRKE
jgi:ubiquinone/menaquinone biosynthesis C-methylase UbiE